MDRQLRQCLEGIRRKAGSPSGRIFFGTLLFFLTFALFFFFTERTPYVLDDYFALYANPENVPLFQMQFHPEDRIVSFTQALVSEWHIFFNWSGRVWVLLTAQVLCMYPKVLFNFLNGLAAALVICLIARHAAGKKPVNMFHYLLLSCLFWLCCPAPGLTLFWMSGAQGYLWSAVFYLAFLYPYRIAWEYGSDAVRRGARLSPVLFLAGLIGCNANENTGGTVILFSAILLYLVRRREKKLPAWGVWGLAGACTGFAILLFSPGLRVRMAVEGHAMPNLFHNFFLQTGYLFQSIPLLFPFCVVLLILLLSRQGFSSWKTHRGIQTGGIYLLMGLCAIYVMVLSPYAPSRTVFGGFLFFLCALGKFLQELPSEDRTWRVLLPCSAFALLLGTLFSMAFALRDISHTNSIQKKRMEFVLRQKAAGQQCFVFRSMAGVNPYNALYKTDLLKSDPESFVNRFYAHAWGVREVRVLDEPCITGMRSEILPDSGNPAP